MNNTIRIAPVRKSVVVETSQARAFEVFTAGIDRWWPKGKHIAEAPVKESIIEPRVELSSEVEVRFLAEGPRRTRVELEHRDFERMGATDGETMRGSVDNGWPGMLELFAKAATQEESAHV